MFFSDMEWLATTLDFGLLFPFLSAGRQQIRQNYFIYTASTTRER